MFVGLYFKSEHNRTNFLSLGFLQGRLNEAKEDCEKGRTAVISLEAYLASLSLKLDANSFRKSTSNVHC